MTVNELFDDPEKRRIAQEAVRQVQRRLSSIEGEIGNLLSEVTKAAKRNEELEKLAKLAVGALGEMVATHGQLPPRTETELAGSLIGAIKAANVKMDPTLRQNLEVIANRKLR